MEAAVVVVSEGCTMGMICRCGELRYGSRGTFLLKWWWRAIVLEERVCCTGGGGERMLEVMVGERGKVVVVIRERFRSGKGV